MTNFTIGEVSASSGVKVPTIRYYEQSGLIPVPERSEGNRRLYEQADIRRLIFIKHARELGFEVDAIRALLQLQDNPDQPCTVADQLARERLIDVEKRIVRLTALRAELQKMLESCAHGRVDECRVIEVLSNHDECIHHQAL
ncbi:DNA-binding transcriptional MerR regulator [Paenochrobactrum gallinarii]|uniref:DNA-binding transcriptional MerR regulator n=1 Tax=Paenochrobactrum gallinarii TaxID=643673 RepID=A0A841M3U7_9HYPH|nr:helix-turn-helix domain-containing protein [Paenochrobactrum gallinarii]MBB6260828.1 DNA-binding transcriptional MerR regulator [Paenochrobactrum gallinarii]